MTTIASDALLVDKSILEVLRNQAYRKDQLTSELGALTFDRFLLEKQITSLQEELIDLQRESRETFIRLQGRYGERFTIDLETGEIKIVS